MSDRGKLLPSNPRPLSASRLGPPVFPPRATPQTTPVSQQGSRLGRVPATAQEQDEALEVDKDKVMQSFVQYYRQEDGPDRRTNQEKRLELGKCIASNLVAVLEDRDRDIRAIVFRCVGGMDMVAGMSGGVLSVSDIWMVDPATLESVADMSLDRLKVNLGLIHEMLAWKFDEGQYNADYLNKAVPLFLECLETSANLEGQMLEWTAFWLDQTPESVHLAIDVAVCKHRLATSRKIFEDMIEFLEDDREGEREPVWDPLLLDAQSTDEESTDEESTDTESTDTESTDEESTGPSPDPREDYHDPQVTDTDRRDRARDRPAAPSRPYISSREGSRSRGSETEG